MNSLRSNLVLAISIALFSPSSAFAHGSHGHSHGPKPKFGELTCESTECEELRNLLDDAHHSIEAGETSSLLQKLKTKFNFKNTALNAYRWYSANIDKPHVQNAVPNLTTMLLTSHAVETVTGFGLTVLGMSNPGGLEQIVLTTIGVTIAMPGADPLCYVLVGAYFLKPQLMNRALTGPRIFVMESKRQMEFMAGLPETWIGAVTQNHRIDGFIKAMDQVDNAILPVKQTGSWLFNFNDESGDTAAQLKFTQLSDGRYGLEEVVLNENVSGDQWMKNLKPFGYNIRSLIDELRTEKARAKRYIRFVEPDPFGKRFYLEAKAFPFINLDTEDCEAALSKKLAIATQE